jgi:hypothetical protein
MATEDATEDAMEDALGGLPLLDIHGVPDATPWMPMEPERVCAVRRWTRRESEWLIEHITKEKLATSSVSCRIGNWAATARAFKHEFHYDRSEKSIASQAVRLRDEPERLLRQPRERQADGVASELQPEARRKKRQRDYSSSTCRWTSAESKWLTARLEEHRASVTQRLADGAQYAPAGGDAPAGGRLRNGQFHRNGARGGVDWEGLAIKHGLQFHKSRTAMALRWHHRQDQQEKRALLQQQDTSAEEFALLQQQDTSAEEFALLQQQDTSAEVFRLLDM